MSVSFSLLRWLGYLLLFFTVWLLWPRDLDGFTLGRDGRVAVPDYFMSNARYVSVREGDVEMESSAQEASFDLAKQEMHAKDVLSFFYNQKGEKTKVTSKEAFFDLNERKVNLLGEVESESPDGFLLKGEEANYYISRRWFESPRLVEGISSDASIKIWGDRSESNLNENKINLLGNAKAEFFQPKRGLTKIRGDSASMDRATEEVQFFKNVKVEQGTTAGTSQSATIFYTKSSRSVRYMSLMEDVKISEKDGRYTRSQVAEFFAPTDTIVLSGFPSVYDGDDAVTGDKITLYRATGVVEVTATNAAANPYKIDGKTIPKSLTKEDEELIP